MSNQLRLGVEVVSAANLMPKDGQGSSSSFVELYFDGQRYRTAVKEKDLNPVWNERFFFTISDPTNLHNLILDAYVYNTIKGAQSRSFLGKARLNGTSFVSYADSVVLHYPLERRSIFSHVKGELGLKVYVTDDHSLRSSSNPIPTLDASYRSTPFPTQLNPSQVPQVASSESRSWWRPGSGRPGYCH